MLIVCNIHLVSNVIPCNIIMLKTSEKNYIETTVPTVEIVYDHY